jgi:hypothetical protein
VLVLASAAAGLSVSRWSGISERLRSELNVSYVGLLSISGVWLAFEVRYKGLGRVRDIAACVDLIVVAAFGLGFSLSRLRLTHCRLSGVCFALLFLALLVGVTETILDTGAGLLAQGCDWIRYDRGRNPALIPPQPLVVACLTATLVPVIPKWIRQELTAVYVVVLVPLVLRDASLTFHEQVASVLLATSGALFSGVRCAWAETRVSGCVFLVVYVAAVARIVGEA